MRSEIFNQKEAELEEQKRMKEHWSLDGPTTGSHNNLINKNKSVLIMFIYV